MFDFLGVVVLDDFHDSISSAFTGPCAEVPAVVVDGFLGGSFALDVGIEVVKYRVDVCPGRKSVFAFEGFYCESVGLVNPSALRDRFG